LADRAVVLIDALRGIPEAKESLADPQLMIDGGLLGG